MAGVSEEVDEPEEYTGQFEGEARISCRDSVMTETSSGRSDSLRDTLRPSPAFTSSPSDLRTSHLPSLSLVLASSQHTEQRDTNGTLYTNGLTRPAPASAISLVRTTRTPRDAEDEFHLSKSVPNLLSDSTEATAAQAQAKSDEVEIEDNVEAEEDDNDVGDKAGKEDGEKVYVKLVRKDERRLDDLHGYMRTNWAGLAVNRPKKQKKVVKKKKALPQKIKGKKGFSNEDIALAATILYSSRRVYNLLRNKKILKLPHIRTVYKKLQHFQCEPGHNPQIFRLLEMRLASLKEKDRVLAVSFDEMHLEEKYSWSPLLRRLFTKHKV